jgi:uncharacterized membrane protein YcgQ (UPF0703/DUF1980 family)
MPHGCSHRHDAGTWYLEQILSLAACGALAGVFLLDWYSGNIVYFIKDKYFLLVLTGAVLLLGLVVVRAIAVWYTAESAGHAHEHRHGHSHDHSHGWAPWRYVVLLLPVALFFLMPAEGLSGAGQQLRVEGLSGPRGDVAGKGEDFGVTFLQLEQAALSEDLRANYEGRTVRLLGLYVPVDSERFTLLRYARGCCPADAIPVRALIVVDRSRSPETLDGKRLSNKWVEATGQVQFLKQRDGLSFVPALVIRPAPDRKLTRLVQVVPQPANPYLD